MSPIKSIAALAAITVATMGFAGAAQAELKLKITDKKPYIHYPHEKHYDDFAMGAGLFGFAAGAMFGTAMAQPQAQVVYVQPGVAWVKYCFSKHKSYSPATNLYLGDDGKYHPCH